MCNYRGVQRCLPWRERETHLEGLKVGRDGAQGKDHAIAFTRRSGGGGMARAEEYPLEHYTNTNCFFTALISLYLFCSHCEIGGVPQGGSDR